MGLTNREIAQQLVVREGTIKYHVKNILRKLGAAGRADAVSRYLRATGWRNRDELRGAIAMSALAPMRNRRCSSAPPTRHGARRRCWGALSSEMPTCTT